MPTSTPTSPPLLERPHAAAVVTSVRSRAEWVDIAKGLGIVLVVAGHAIDGLLKAGLVTPDGGWAAAFYLIYTFHMPLFFLLAGLFVAERLASDAGAFVLSAFTRIAWPYMLWSVIQLAVIDVLGGFVNTPSELSFSRIVSLLWEPTSQFWFLQALLVLHLVSRVLLPRIGPAALMAVMLLARGVVEVVDLPVLLAMPARFGLFYALGILSGPALLAAAGAATRERGLAVSAAAACVWAAAALTAYAYGLGRWSLGAMPAALAGCVFVIALATLPRRAVAAAGLMLGQASMAIYLLHVLFVAGTRIVLHKLFGMDEPGVIFVLACAAGVVGPLLAHRLARRAGMSRVLGLG